MIEKDLVWIKLENPKDYRALLIAAHLYTENKKSDNPSSFIENNMIAVIKDLLDKYGVKYADDITGGI